MDGIASVFESARLRYICTDAFDEEFRAFVPQILQDPVIHAYASSRMIKPTGKKDADGYAESVSKSLLGVVICLSPEEERRRRAEQASNSEAGADSSQNESENKDAKPTMIGVACLGWGGVAPEIAHNRNAGIGISLTKPYQNKGYGREAINWMLDWAFMHAGLHTVEISAASYNPRALHLYKDLGFVLEGRKREKIWFNRGWHDLIEFGMTEKEWETVRGIKSV
ncbi:acyl-CoA N-acyltransferase [Mariannaea sp. PMI_226]|nr:acyl-CoA N-acyltransferase [Mariannaea sp. PMI_226]